jgi:hypothetical protein
MDRVAAGSLMLCASLIISALSSQRVSARATVQTATSPAEVIQPATFREYLTGHLDERFAVFAFTPGGLNAGFAQMLRDRLGDPQPRALELIRAYAVNGRGRDLIALAASGDVESLWYVHPVLHQPEVNIVAGIE